jgi:hypothetical protein
MTPSVSWDVLWRVSRGTAQCIHVPADRTRYYIRRNWHVLICDEDFPVAPSTWPLNVQQNPTRVIDRTDES